MGGKELKKELKNYLDNGYISDSLNNYLKDNFSKNHTEGWYFKEINLNNLNYSIGDIIESNDYDEWYSDFGYICSLINSNEDKSLSNYFFLKINGINGVEITNLIRDLEIYNYINDDYILSFKNKYKIIHIENINNIHILTISNI